MKACRVTFSLPLLLEQLGLEHTDQLIPYSSCINQETGTVSILLTGDHPSLPDIQVGEDIPDAVIECKKIESRIVIR